METELFKFLLAGGSPTVVICFLAWQSLKCMRDVNGKIDKLNESLNKLIPANEFMQREINELRDRISKLESK